MFNASFLKTKSITQQLKTFGPEELIFRQGQPGENMFIIIEGYVRIVFESDTHKHLVGIAGPGEVLGEKAVLKEKKKYLRNFSAYSSNDSTLLEVTPKTLETVLSGWPDFYIRLLKLVEERLGKANELVAILQNPNKVDRVCEYLFYFQKHLCAKFPKGMYATIVADEVAFATNVEKHLVIDILAELSERKVLTEVQGGYILANEKGLRQSLPSLRELAAA